MRAQEYRPSREEAYEATVRAHRCPTLDDAFGCPICQEQVRLAHRDEKRAEASQYIHDIGLKAEPPRMTATEIRQRTALPTDAQARKNAPMCRGLLDYFPAALAAVAECSRIANEQHNPGQEMHWARDKSTDQADCIVRHLIERGAVDTDGVRHSAKVAWRALALLQTELEAEGSAPGRASRFASQKDLGCAEGQTA